MNPRRHVMLGFLVRWKIRSAEKKTGEPLDFIPSSGAQAAFNKALKIYEKYKTAIARK